ncbi:hypothetical protein GOODEAATRI_009471 [Goodea atripinnis]|uniref:Nidogen G2 beta-barrel domain-containing protein n=1 Tax=Goodea atripinnis TaxID=208336 RepID=A0ABV0MGH1_9TELE
MVNDREFGVSFLEANITDNEEQGTSTLEARLDNIPPTVGPLLKVLVSVFTPIYWTTVLQNGATRNGFSFTQGHFRQESQLEFETGVFVEVIMCIQGPQLYLEFLLHHYKIGSHHISTVFDLSDLTSPSSHRTLMSHMCRRAKDSCTHGHRRPTREEAAPWGCAVIIPSFMRARRSAKALYFSCSRFPE